MQKLKVAALPESKTAFESCPIEISQRICQLACLDGGSTGRKLCLVSRHMRDLSAPYKYHSVIVKTLQQADMLVKILKKLPSQHRRVVHLFFVCDYNPIHYKDLGPHSITLERMQSAFPLFFWDSVVHKKRKHTYEDSESMLHKSLSKILEYSGSSLKTLVVPAQKSTLWSTNELLPPLPALQELTLACPSGRASRLSETSSLSLFPTLPSLTHIVFDMFASGPVATMKETIKVAPAVVNIRLPWKVLDTLESQSELQTLVSQWTNAEATIPPLQRVLMPAKAFTEACADIEAIDPRFVTVRSRLETIADIQDSWIDRINGGEGAWDRIGISRKSQKHTRKTKGKKAQGLH